MDLDIIFCINMNCKNKECTRNLKNYKKTHLYKNDIIKYISVSTFEECEFWNENKE